MINIKHISLFTCLLSVCFPVFGQLLQLPDVLVTGTSKQKVSLQTGALSLNYAIPFDSLSYVPTPVNDSITSPPNLPQVEKSQAEVAIGNAGLYSIGNYKKYTWNANWFYLNDDWQQAKIQLGMLTGMTKYYLPKQAIVYYSYDQVALESIKRNNVLLSLYWQHSLHTGQDWDLSLTNSYFNENRSILSLDSSQKDLYDLCVRTHFFSPMFNLSANCINQQLVTQITHPLSYWNNGKVVESFAPAIWVGATLYKVFPSINFHWDKDLQDATFAVFNNADITSITTSQRIQSIPWIRLHTKSRQTIVPLNFQVQYEYRNRLLLSGTQQYLIDQPYYYHDANSAYQIAYHDAMISKGSMQHYYHWSILECENQLTYQYAAPQHTDFKTVPYLAEWIINNTISAHFSKFTITAAAETQLNRKDDQNRWMDPAWNCSATINYMIRNDFQLYLQGQNLANDDIRPMRDIARIPLHVEIGTRFAF